MSEKTPAVKGYIRPDAAIGIVNEIPSVVAALGLPGTVRLVQPADADIVILFVRDRTELAELVPRTVAELHDGALLWIVYRKGAKSAGLDMSRDDVWYAVEPLGMRPLGLVGIDDAWSAFRFKQGEAAAS